MKILNSHQVRSVDEETIRVQNISSFELMERAARAFVNEFMKYYNNTFYLTTICGTGNNGGDGLAISRMLHQEGYEVRVIIIDVSKTHSDDFKANLSLISKQLAPIFIKSEAELPEIKNKNSVIIDGLFGSGLNRPLEDPYIGTIKKTNALGCDIVSIDIASGLLADAYTPNRNAVIKPTRTISFEIPKLAFFMEENEDFIGELTIVDIGLDKKSKESKKNSFETIDNNSLPKYTRPKHGHKGTFGHGLLIAGQEGMMGAAVLAAKACMRGGIGKTTVHLSKSGLPVMQISVPEAIIDVSENEKFFNDNWDEFSFKPYDAIAIGPGIGQEHVLGFSNFLKNIGTKKLIIDADGINIIGKNPELLSLLPQHSILTPHPKEFKNLTGQIWKNDFEKIEILIAFSIKHSVIICLKGHYTAIAIPTGQVFFNTTGNNGMATAGSGDVLTGLMLAYLSQNFDTVEAAKMAVFDHGKAGDYAAAYRSEKSMIASDIIEFLR